LSLRLGGSNLKYASVRATKPRARTDDLVIEEVDDELLIYDSENKRAHCLSEVAARVWRACDGESDVSALSETLELSAEVVKQALDELEALELLGTQGDLQVLRAGSGNGNGNGNGRMTRRQLTGRSARVGAGVLAIPLVYSINVSSAMAVLTPTPFQCFLHTAQSCGTATSCGRTAGCCCCCQGGGSCKICTSVAACPGFDCGGGETGTHCSSTGDLPADDRGCCGFTGSKNCGCGFGAGGGCCNRFTGVACEPSDTDPDCVPCCAGVPLTPTAQPGCCTSTTVNNCA
jgi:hypothetical protein